MTDTFFTLRRENKSRFWRRDELGRIAFTEHLKDADRMTRHQALEEFYRQVVRDDYPQVPDPLTAPAGPLRAVLGKLSASDILAEPGLVVIKVTIDGPVWTMKEI